jgi:hypothetical protein
MSLTDSPRAYEREADASRARLSNSLDQLANSLTPGRVLDEVLTYAKGGGGHFLKGLGNAASANPIPSLLIGVGTALFLSGKAKLPSAGERGYGRSTPAHRGSALPESSGALASVFDVAKAASSYVGSAMSSAARGISSSVASVAGVAADGASEVAGVAADTAVAGGSRVAEAAGYVGDAAAGAARTLGEGVNSAAGSVSEAGASAARSAMDEAAYLRDESRRLMHDARDTVTRLTREQPLVVAAAGLAVGVAIAALIPRSKLEDRWMGEASDAVKGAVSGVASEEFVKAREATGRVVEEVKAAAADEGLSAEGAADVVRNMGEKLKSKLP